MGIGEQVSAENGVTDGINFVQQQLLARVEARGGHAEGKRKNEREQTEHGTDDGANRPSP